MASTSNPLEEILNSDVADSPFSSLVPPIQPPVSPTVARVDDRPSHRYVPSTTAAAAVVASPVMSQAIGPSSAAIQSALLYNHHPAASVSTAAASSKDFNGSSPSSTVVQAAMGSGGPAVNIPVRTEGTVAAPQTVANPTAASFAQSLGNFLNAAQFKQSNVTGAGLSTDQKPLVTNIGAMSAIGSTVPAQVQMVSPLRNLHPVASNMISMKSDATTAAMNLKPFAVTRQPPLTVGQQTLVTGQQQQQHMTLIQSSSPGQGTVGFPSQHVQIVNVPTQNVQRTSVAPVSNLRTLAPRIAINQPVRIQQQPGQNISMMRPQNVVTQQISFAPGVQQNLLQGNMVLIKNERGQMVLLQNPGQHQQPSASNSPVIQSAMSSQARPQLSGQLGLVQTTLTGQGLTAVSSASTQFIQPTVTAAVRISSTGQGLVSMHSVVPMLTQPRPQTGLHSVALSTPSIMSRLVPQSSVAQTNATPLATPASGPAIANTYMKEIQENVRKCKNFLSTLMKLASNQPHHVVNNVKNLIQGLIDGDVEPEDFTNQLQKELKSSPQPYLVPFLRKSLPFLRNSLFQNKMTIDGIRPPPASMATIGLSLATTSTAAVPVFSVASSVASLRPRPPVIPNSLTSKTPVPTILTPQQQQLRLSMIQQQQQQQHPQLSGLRMVGPKPTLTADHTKAALTRPALFPLPPGVNATHLTASAPPPTSTITGATIISNGLLPQINSGLPAVQQHKGEKRKYEALRDDDDINDVATMGGVNLTEESRNILATNSELVSGQLRSCKDEKLLEVHILMQRINDIVQHKGLDTVSQEVAHAVSHAVQDQLRTLVEQLSLFVTHRLENYRLDPRFEASNDRRTQLKFLEELGSIERRRHEEAERGVLMRAARSRAKAEDPEQAKLKERAKAMQQAEMEEIRQRESNLTALAAIGPRRPRTAQDATGSVDSGSPLNKTIVPLRPRIKRVNLRDLLFLLEQRKESRRSMMLYKAFLK